MTIGIRKCWLQRRPADDLEQDGLAHVPEHCDADPPSDTWTGPACPGPGLALGPDEDNAILQIMCGTARSRLQVRPWSRPLADGLLRDYCGPHDLQPPHLHSIVITRLTTGARAA